jgi:hypothetical protein
MSSETPDPNAELVPVFATTEFGLVPLVCAALEESGIEYMVQDTSLSSQVVGQRSTMSVGETEEPKQILVRAEDAARARAALRDFTESAGAPLTASPAAARDSTPGVSLPIGNATIDLVDEATGMRLGGITDAQLRSLQDALEEESEDDRDYYIDVPTLALLEDAGVDAAVVAMLRQALGSRDGMDVRWEPRK